MSTHTQGKLTNRTLQIGAMHYFMVEVNTRRYWVNGSCPHRGGPLFLGQLNPTKDAIICPWHGKQCQLKVLINNALPAVCVEKKWCVIHKGEVIHVNQ